MHPAGHRRSRAAIAATFLIASTAHSVAAPANTLTELWRALNSCIRAPSVGVGSELTIVFALKRAGSLFGRPRIAHSHRLGDAEAHRAFVAAAIGSSPDVCPSRLRKALGRPSQVAHSRSVSAAHQEKTSSRFDALSIQ